MGACAQGTEIPYTDVVGCLNSTLYNPIMCPTFRYLADNFLNENRTAMYYLFSPQFEPASHFGAEWLDSFRAAMARVSAQTGYQLSLSGIGSDSCDAMSSVYDAAPMMVGLTVAVMLLFVAVSFKSVLVPLRSVLTVSLSLAFVYGLCSLIYGVRVAFARAHVAVFAVHCD